MKKFVLLFLILCFTKYNYAQESVDAIRKQATTQAQQQDYTDAIQSLNQGLTQYPDNLDLLKDKAYISFLARDYQHAIEVGKIILVRDDADEQSYQIIGLTYKAIADYKEAENLYKRGLKKFPKSGVLYGEYGDMLTQYGNKHAAIQQWEKGIQADANYSGNYYYAAKYYADEKNILWSIIYGEIFINIESLTARTTEIKNVLLNDYKLVLAGKSGIDAFIKTGNDFEKAVAAALNAAIEPATTDNIIPEMITALRSRFIINWNAAAAINYPFHLFDFQTQLMRDGLFDAYNQWLFGAIINKDRYDNWIYTHDEEMQGFTQLQRNVLFKMPPEQYYGHS